MTFIKFLNRQGSPLLHQIHFESWVHSEATVGGHLLVFRETTKFNSSSSFMIFSCYFRMWNVCCASLLFCSEQDLPYLLPDSCDPWAFLIFHILVFFKGPAFVPFILFCETNAFIWPFLIKCSLALFLMEGKWEGKRVQFLYFRILNVCLTTLYIVQWYVIVRYC